ncbi:sulfite exporter TauE/SafE family protein [Phocoenobacter skyensis]|uniref:Probable membrane transporter protein n=1 Tax=Phocoenobacter skyensis TaxID=97481 RepID=A0A1H7WYR6_9PAST|nr:sulfite exporter TauE/SafE family protein [Pasteurella skyensis]MDP8079270.1 sulfite exporter TauE/SafE family protein [Pasteurella skyensis]MDP8085509.1 sulfite exporter TauE/SafE family protein [Pasteurella skyensis]MDP8170480.1 sulfite exporter TauE/SafE family protein [Pasteurella skyensis]MDP8174558.1 sulfite exporter TauE/SafE family protein [Pasteurella skyensis]MDP8185136.1 sulfite exporter TauE/SafE family protein [Pasteurella skyensis]
MEILVIGLLLFGAMLHGITGLGFPMISTISIAIIFPLPVAIALVILPNIIINVMVLLPSRNTPKETSLTFLIQKFWLLILSSIIGCVIGVLLLKALPISWLYLLLSLATLFYVFYAFFENQKHPHLSHNTLLNSSLKMILFGGLAGVIGGATNAMSSILMMYLLANSNDKNEIIKTSNLCFLLAKIVQFILLEDVFNQLTTKELWALPIITLLSIIALLIGINIRHKISVTLFKKIILVILLLLSLKASWNAFVLM